MSSTIRLDALSLMPGVSVDTFERFMTDTFMPHMIDRFKGPTRVSRADLDRVTLLHGAQSTRKYLLLTAWQGATESVLGASFEHARMNTNARTDALLVQLGTMAKRSTEKVYTETATLQAASRP